MQLQTTILRTYSKLSNGLLIKQSKLSKIISQIKSYFKTFIDEHKVI